MSRNFDIIKECQPAINDLPGDLSHLAEIIESVCPTKGVEITLAIAQEFRGTSLYLHNIDGLKRVIRNRWIIEQYTKGKRVSDLARKIGLSTRQVRTILNS